MPTTRPRYTLTETEDLARSLDAAAKLWPELRDDRAALLRQLVDEGRHRVDALAAQRRADRLAAIRDTAGILSGVYPPGAAQQLREEWPE